MKKNLAHASFFAGLVSSLKKADFIIFRVTASGIHYLCVYITLKGNQTALLKAQKVSFPFSGMHWVELKKKRLKKDAVLSLKYCNFLQQKR